MHVCIILCILVNFYLCRVKCESDSTQHASHILHVCYLIASRLNKYYVWTVIGRKQCGSGDKMSLWMNCNLEMSQHVYVLHKIYPCLIR